MTEAGARRHFDRDERGFGDLFARALLDKCLCHVMFDRKRTADVVSAGDGHEMFERRRQRAGFEGGALQGGIAAERRRYEVGEAGERGGPAARVVGFGPLAVHQAQRERRVRIRRVCRDRDRDPDGVHEFIACGPCLRRKSVVVVDAVGAAPCVRTAEGDDLLLTVLGAGVLGGQIGWHCPFKGKIVVIYDPFPEALRMARVAHDTYAQIYMAQLGASEADIAATRARLTLSGNLEAAVAPADFVIEAVPEIPETKTQVYRQMAGLLPAHTLIATNSSTLLARDFAEASGRPARYCALHFANLIWALNLAEIMAHAGTARETLTAVAHFAIEIGMVPIPVEKEQNGYVLNSWFVPLLTLPPRWSRTAWPRRRTWIAVS